MNRVLELVLAVTIVGATLAFGGVQPLTYMLMESALFLAMLLLLWKQTRQGEIALRLPLWPVLFALWAIVQLVPLPSFVIGWLSPARFLDPTLSGLSPGQWVWSTLSIYPHDTVVVLVKFVAYLSAFVLAAYLFDSGKRKSTLIRALIFLGCFEAGYGMVQYLTGWHKIFTYAKQFDLEEATGTYINRNHFAGLLELILPFTVAAGFYSFQIWSERKQAGLDRHASAERSSAGMRTIFYLFLVVIIFVAVVFSRSRGGIMATVLSIVFIALLAQLKTRRRIWALAIFLFLVCAIGYGLWIGLDPVLARFEQIRTPDYLQMEGRIAIWKDSLRLVQDHPVTGTGLGTFGMASRRYQSVLVDKYVDHAHNDYLEFAAETGLVGVSLLFLPMLYLLGRMTVSFLDDPRRYRRTAILGCIGSTLAILLHSITDFNLQIPANALIFAVVLGIGYKTVCVERREEERTNARAAPGARG